MNLKSTLLLAFFCFTTSLTYAQIGLDISYGNDYKVSYDAFSNSAMNFSTGLGQLGVVGTKYNVQNAAVYNPARMFDAAMTLDVSYANLNYELYNNNAITNFGTISGHKVFGKHALGIFNKQVFENNYSTHMDTGYPRDTITRPNSFVTGIAYGYKLGKKISFGATLNHYYARFQEDDTKLVCTRDACWYANAENYQGLTVSLGTYYQDKIAISEKQTLNWSVGASFNQIGGKQSAFSYIKDRYFVPIQIYAGASIGYQSNFNNGSSLNVTLLYQGNKLMEAKYSDNNDNEVDDRIENPVIRSILYAFVDEEFSEEFKKINQHIGIETIYETKGGLEFGLRSAYEKMGQFRRGALYTGLHFGYSNFYVDFGRRFALLKYGRSVDILALSLGYRVDL
jgi:hypothetical protein